MGRQGIGGYINMWRSPSPAQKIREKVVIVSFSP